jgi:CheY-like chemotaxis protein
LPHLPHKQRILVCDNTGDLFELLAHRSDEIEFIKTDDLKQAIQEAKAVPAHAVVINTASSSGSEPLLKQARLNLPDTPIIVSSFPSRTQDMVEAGAITHLIKPIMRADLENALKAVGRPVRCVLIVDDDPDFRQLLTRMLLMYDGSLQVVGVGSGEKALAQLRHGGPDLMLIDIAMPDMDGWQTLAQKKQEASIKDIPAIIVSAEDPTRQPMLSQTLAATMGAGISLDKFLRCSLELSSLLLEPD